MQPRQAEGKYNVIENSDYRGYFSQEESEEWACQAQTYRNEVESVKADMKSELETKEKQIKILQQTLQVLLLDQFLRPLFLLILPGNICSNNNNNNAGHAAAAHRGSEEKWKFARISYGQPRKTITV